MSRSDHLGRLWHSERPFALAFAVAAAVRVLIAVAFPPAFLMSDGPTYLGFVDRLFPSPDRPVGYGALLRGLSWVSRSLVLVTTTQLVLGLATAVLAYALLRRWGVTARLATLATVPLLFDALPLMLEHAVLSDELFAFLLMVGVSFLAWSRPPRARTTAAAGLVLGTATLVRIVGEPTLVVGVAFLLLAAATWRARVVQVLVLGVAFALPLTVYAAWFHQENGAWALTQASGRALYMRTTTFVDCSTLSLPSYERTLCPADPLSNRQDPTWYGWHDPDTVPRLRPPLGITPDQAMKDFAIRAIGAQPAAYAEVAVRDLALGFWAPTRVDHFDYSTSVKWTFAQYVDYVPTPLWTEPAFASHGGEMPETRHPFADVLAVYGRVVYVPGPVLLVLLVLAVGGLAVRRREEQSVRPLGVLFLMLPIVLILLPDLTAEFVWRYELPLITLLPLSAALGWTRWSASAGRSRPRAPTARTVA